MSLLKYCESIRKFTDLYLSGINVILEWLILSYFKLPNEQGKKLMSLYR